MSQGNRICFDASIQEKAIGIGIYDDSAKVKIHTSYNIVLDSGESYKAEFIGLVTAMEYMYTNKIKNPLLFTDNIKLAENGIPDYLIEKYGKARLYWIPREFNKVADKLSKSSKQVSKTLSSTKLTKKYFTALDKNNQLKALKIIAKTEFSKLFLKEMQECDMDRFREIKNLYRKSDYVFVQMVLMLNLLHGSYKGVNKMHSLKSNCSRKNTITMDAIIHEYSKVNNV